MDYATLLQLLDSTVRLATPLLLACLAGLYSERAGIFDIGLEGKMLMAAMGSACWQASARRWCFLPCTASHPSPFAATS
jgi:general nucleoside transport system permease protein